MRFEPVELRTDRLFLRPFTIEDVEALFRMYCNDDVAFFAFPETVTRSSVEQRLVNQAPWQNRPSFAITFEGGVVGEVTLIIDHANLIANLGYVIAREYWGKGLATEAARAVVGYGFRTFNLAKIYARADPRNPASIRVMEKLGMRREGLLRSHVLRRGERADRVLYGLLREEWEGGARRS